MFEVGAFFRLLSWLLVNSRLLVVTGDLSHWSSKRDIVRGVCEHNLCYEENKYTGTGTGLIFKSPDRHSLTFGKTCIALNCLNSIFLFKIRTSGKLLKGFDGVETLGFFET